MLAGLPVDELWEVFDAGELLVLGLGVETREGLFEGAYLVQVYLLQLEEGQLLYVRNLG